MRKKIVILISGYGSNMQAIVNANIQSAEIVAIISNKQDAPGLLWSQKLGLNTQVLSHKLFSSRQDYDLALIELIDQFQPDLVVLAGFMRILSQEFCLHYQAKLMNIHPSLLPAFPGLNTHQSAIDMGCKIAGCTVHFVTPELDSGPIIAQAAVPISPQDTAKSLANKVLACEHTIYPIAVQDFVLDNLSIHKNRVINKRIFHNYQHSEQKITNF